MVFKPIYKSSIILPPLRGGNLSPPSTLPQDLGVLIQWHKAIDFTIFEKGFRADLKMVDHSPPLRGGGLSQHSVMHKAPGGQIQRPEAIDFTGLCSPSFLT